MHKFRTQVASSFIWAILLSILAACGPEKPSEIPGMEAGQKPPDLSQVQSMLASDDVDQRADGILLAMQWDMKATAPRLLELAGSDKNPAVRQTAAMALGQFKAEQAAPLLRRMLEGDQGVQVEFIMEAAARLGDPAVGPALVPYLKSDVLNTRLVAMQTLVAIDARDQGARILADAKKNKDPEIGRAYTMALGKLQVKAAGTHLRQVARAVQPGPNRAAAYLALGRIDDHRAVPLLVEGLQAGEPKLRENASKALIMIKDPTQLKAVYPLLTHKEKDTRFRASDVIAEIPAPGSEKELLNLLNNKSPLGSAPAAIAAGRLRLQNSRLPIEDILKDRQATEREVLARALGWLGNKASLDVLMAVLKEKDGEGRYGAAWSLGIIGDARAVPALVAATRSSDEYLARLATEALGNIEHADSLQALIDLARSNSRVRNAALDSLAVTPGEKSTAVLMEFLDHEDENARRIAIRAMGDRKQQAAIPTLIKELQEANPSTAPTTMQALRKITGQDFLHAGQWLHWYEVSQKQN